MDEISTRMDWGIRRYCILVSLIMILLPTASAKENQNAENGAITSNSVTLKKVLRASQLYQNSFNDKIMNAVNKQISKSSYRRSKRCAISSNDNDLKVNSAIYSENKILKPTTYLLFLAAASVFVVSTSVLLICSFCDSCLPGKKKSLENNSNGYIGKINLADIKVIYNPAAAGAVHLPVYAHGVERSVDGFSNPAFSRSQESLSNATNAAPTPAALSNKPRLQMKDPSPATLQPAKLQELSSSHKSRSGRRSSNPSSTHAGTVMNSYAGEERGRNVDRNGGRMKDFYMENSNNIYENEHAKTSSFGKTGHSKKVNTKSENTAGRRSKSSDYVKDGQKEMNDTAIRNMYVR